jgi:hypothetical protein
MQLKLNKKDMKIDPYAGTTETIYNIILHHLDYG